MVDDIGLPPPSPQTAAEGLYRLIDACYEQRSVIVSYNLHPSGFDQLIDHSLASALVDRLMHHAHVIVTEGESIRLADHSIELHAGEELAIAATKTYTTQLAAIALLSSALNGEPGGLDALAADVRSVLDQSDRIAGHAAGFADVVHAAVLGRGFNFSTAFEWSLKLQELTYILAQPYSTADFMHGPLALVSSGFPIFAVAPTGAPHPAIYELLERLTTELGSRLAVISDDDATLDLADAPIRIPATAEWLSPIVSVVAAQIFSYHLALVKGIDPDSPRTIQKVTRTI